MSSITPPAPGTIEESLDQLRQLIRRYLSLRGATLAGICFILFFWITGFLDYFPVWLGAQDSPTLVRATFLVLGAAALGYFGWRYLVRPLAIHWTDRAIALLIERKYPAINSSLITYVESKNVAKERAKSELAKYWNIESDPQLQRQVAMQAQQSVGAIDIYDIMRWKPLRFQCGLFGALVALSFLGFLAMPNWSTLWSKRLFLLSDELWPRQSSIFADRVEIEIPNFTGELERKTYSIPFSSKQITIPFDQSARLFASASLDKKVVPTACTISYALAGGQSGRANLRRMPENRRARLLPFILDGSPLERVKEDIAFSLRGGDSRISDLEIQTVPAVVLADVQLNVRFPEYLRRRQTSTYLDGMQPYQNGLRLPEGVDVSMQLTANTPLQRCEYQITTQGESGQERSQGSINVDGNKFNLPLGQLRQNILVEFRAWDVHGHCATEIAQFVLSIMQDQLPSAELVLEGIGTSVTPLARIPFKVVVKDDHDIKGVLARLAISDKPPIDKPLPFHPSGEMTGEIDLRDLRDNQKIEIQPNEVLVVSTQTNDYYDLDKSERTVSSNSIPLAVVTQDEMLVLLDRRELDLRNRLERVIVELKQLETLLERNRTKEKPAPGEQPPAEEANVETEDYRIPLIRTQEAKIQAEKSESEVSGIATQVAMLVAEMINNRIDSKDRQIRLEDNVRVPLLEVLGKEFKDLVVELKASEAELRDSQFKLERVDRSIDLNKQVYAKLDEVLKRMLDVEDFNEVVDMVRDILEKEKELIEKSKQQQKQKALDLFND